MAVSLKTTELSSLTLCTGLFAQPRSSDHSSLTSYPDTDAVLNLLDANGGFTQEEKTVQSALLEKSKSALLVLKPPFVLNT